MAYNNGFPMSYPQYFPQYAQQAAAAVPATQPQANSLIWVQGEAGAKSYLVAPNTTVTLWDSESQTIYLKSADASGMPSLKVLNYTIKDSASQNAPVGLSDAPNFDFYVTKDELQAFEEKIQKKLDKLVKRRKDDDEDE